MADRQLVEDIANRIRPGGEGLIEKAWHVVRAIGVLSSLDHGEARPALSGGTSLSIGWGLIKRFSEDVDFKVARDIYGGGPQVIIAPHLTDARCRRPRTSGP